MEVSEPFSTSETNTSEIGCSFEPKLLEGDPFYNKKKHLLQLNGFITKEHILIKNFSNPDEISASLNALLQFERIVRLDEVELYFLEDDANLSSDFYSHRNEIAALNSILHLVENSLCNCTRPQKDILTELRSSIISKIGALGDEDSMTSVIMEDCFLVRENLLVKRGEDNGMVSRLWITCVDRAGRGVIAQEDLKVGDTVLEIPTSLIISEELLKTSDMYHILEKRREISSETMLMLWSMKERCNSKSQFRLYFDTLPEEFHTGLSFGLDAIMVLEGCMLFDEITQAKEHLRTEYDQLIVPLCDEYPDVFPPDMFTWENFLWACELWYSNSMKIMFPDGELRTCLVPVAGFLNHSLNPHITNYGTVNSTTNTLKFSLSRPCAKGKECFLSYGNHPSSHLITFYGFIPKGDNPYDVFPLELEYFDKDSDEGELRNVTHMARGTWFSRNHKIFHYGLPSPLLEYFRIIQYPMTHSKNLLQESLEGEMEILKQLYDLFTDLMDPVAESDLADSENLGWDVKLALEYKDIQTKILSSIVASCYSGLHLVKYSLYKCMDEDTRG